LISTIILIAGCFLTVWILIWIFKTIFRMLFVLLKWGGIGAKVLIPIIELAAGGLTLFSILKKSKELRDDEIYNEQKSAQLLGIPVIEARELMSRGVIPARQLNNGFRVTGRQLKYFLHDGMNERNLR